MAFLRAVVDGSFPNLEDLCVRELDEEMLKHFVVMLEGSQERHKSRLKTFCVNKDASDQTVREIKVLLPTVKVRTHAGLWR